MDNLCKECKKPIIGRTDKKFCSAQCRSMYHNRKRKEEAEYINKITGILKHNRNILLKLCPEGKAKVKRADLLSKGFDFNYFTNIHITSKKNCYYFCFDYGYLKLNKTGDYLIVKKN